MAFQDQYSFEDLTNIAESLVLEELETQLAQHPDRDQFSNDAVVDMAAFSLNSIKPMYRANLLGRLYADALSDQHRAEIKTAVAASIQRVIKNPPNE